MQVAAVDATDASLSDGEVPAVKQTDATWLPRPDFQRQHFSNFLFATSIAITRIDRPLSPVALTPTTGPRNPSFRGFLLEYKDRAPDGSGPVIVYNQGFSDVHRRPRRQGCRNGTIG